MLCALVALSILSGRERPRVPQATVNRVVRVRRTAVTATAGWVSPESYAWVSNDSFVFAYGRESPGRHAYRDRVELHKFSRSRANDELVAGITARWSKTDEIYTVGRASNDGKWLTFTGGYPNAPGPMITASLDGKQWTEHRRPASTMYGGAWSTRPYVWLTCSAKPGELNLCSTDPISESEPRALAVKLSAGTHIVPGSRCTVLGRVQHGDVLVFVDSNSNNSGALLAVTPDWLSPSVRAIHANIVERSIVQAIELSPNGKYVALVITNPATKPRLTESKIVVGRVELSNASPVWRDEPRYGPAVTIPVGQSVNGLRWLPDSRSLSYIVGGVLYVSPVAK